MDAQLMTVPADMVAWAMRRLDDVLRQALLQRQAERTSGGEECELADSHVLVRGVPGVAFKQRGKGSPLLPATQGGPMAEQPTQGQADTVRAQMPRYVCHKEVWALQIKDARRDGRLGGIYELVPIDERYGPVIVSREWYERHRPQVGGYYVVCEDGYASYSPQQAFESGYTLVR